MTVSKGDWVGPLALGAGTQALCLVVCCSPRIDGIDDDLLGKVLLAGIVFINPKDPCLYMYMPFASHQSIYYFLSHIAFSDCRGMSTRRLSAFGFSFSFSCLTVCSAPAMTRGDVRVYWDIFSNPGLSYL